MHETATLLSGTPTLPPRSVALTFDDGPGPKSAELARALRDEGVPATFFVLGESIERYGEALAAHRDCGHAIALHSDVHEAFTSVSLAERQLARCRERIAEHLGDDALGATPWYRPPYGVGDEAVPGYAGPVGWHAHGYDWKITYREGQTVEGCVDTLTENLLRHDGGVALLHDFAPPSEFTASGKTEKDLDLRVLDITALLLERLRREGFSFVDLPGADGLKALI